MKSINLISTNHKKCGNGIKIDWNDVIKFFDQNDVIKLFDWNDVIKLFDWNDVIKLFDWNDVVKFFIHEQEEMY